MLLLQSAIKPPAFSMIETCGRISSLEVIDRQLNTLPKMIDGNYLDEDDVMMVEENRKL